LKLQKNLYGRRKSRNSILISKSKELLHRRPQTCLPACREDIENPGKKFSVYIISEL
jgi:hypothetical protein